MLRMIEREPEPKAPKPHWINPWPNAVPVPIEELALCVMHIGHVWLDNGSSFVMTPERMIEHWHQCGRDKLDAYVLPGPLGYNHIGVRWSNDGNDYYSPYGDQGKIVALLDRYLVVRSQD